MIDKFTVFTTRCDTLFGATYCVFAPEHKLVEKITTPEQKEAVEAYVRDIAETCQAKISVLPDVSCQYERGLLTTLSRLVSEIDVATTKLESSLVKYKTIDDVTEASVVIRDDILPKMTELRIVCDEAETVTAEERWPFPTYEKLLFSVK